MDREPRSPFRESAQPTIADGGAAATSGLNNRRRAVKGSDGGPC